jgi:putative tryptophan/tyrosine transport system substrate-binding protein
MDAGLLFSRRPFLLGSLAVVGQSLLVVCGVPLAETARAPRHSRIGFLGSTAAQSRLAPLQEGLWEHGYCEGETISIDSRWSDTNEGLRSAADDLVQSGAEVRVTAGGPATGFAWAVTKSVPIVGVNFTVPAPFASGFARTGTKVTGVVAHVSALGAKRLQLLKETVPSATRVALLWSGYRSTAGGGGGQSNMARD